MHTPQYIHNQLGLTGVSRENSVLDMLKMLRQIVPFLAEHVQLLLHELGEIASEFLNHRWLPHPLLLKYGSSCGGSWETDGSPSSCRRSHWFRET